MVNLRFTGERLTLISPVSKCLVVEADLIIVMSTTKKVSPAKLVTFWAVDFEYIADVIIGSKYILFEPNHLDTLTLATIR